jgi:DNA modification methylase
MTDRRRPTATSNFGVGRRESHDASGFYARFAAPVLADAIEMPETPAVTNELFVGNSSRMSQVTDNSVALVVTSPPYFAGKEYEEALGEGHIPATYFEYLGMLENVFAECMRKLEPGGRIAVNVANLGRRPYRSLSADVIRIFEDLGLLLRGEIIWKKAEAAGGSCAWGSFQSPANPVLRDLTERIIVASKGRFDRAVPRRDRKKRKLPSEPSLYKDDFFEMTTDVWDFPPERATRVGHPAPFPLELPRRLIDLYTYKGDLVLDPFVGSGTTAVAAVQSRRCYIGYDTDAAYIDAARARLEAETAGLKPDSRPSPRVPDANPQTEVAVAIPEPVPVEHDDPVAFQRRAVQEGKSARQIGREILELCGFRNIKKNYRSPVGVEVNFTAEDANGDIWYFDVSGAFTTFRPGLRRTDTLWKALGKAAALMAETDANKRRLVLLTTDLPAKGSAGFKALENVYGKVYFDAIEMFRGEGQRRLREYAEGYAEDEPIYPLMEPLDFDATPHAD